MVKLLSKCRDPGTESWRCIWCEKAEPGHLETRQAISNAIINPKDMLSSKCKTRTCLQQHSVSPARRLDREMRRRLILQEKRFFTSYFIDVDTFYLFVNWFSTCVSDDQIYLSGSRLYACIKTRTFKGIPEKLHHYQIWKKWFTWHVISIIAGNKSHAHYKTYLHTVNVYHTWPSQFCQLRFSFFSTNNQWCSLVPKQSTLSSDRIRGPTRFGKALNLIFPKYAWLRSRNDS